MPVTSVNLILLHYLPAFFIQLFRVLRELFLIFCLWFIIIMGRMDFKGAYIALAALEVILMMFFEDRKILVLMKFKLLFFILWLVGFVSCK